ncbi:uncharacterized protein EI90DRAFT_955045 [Cantharellus anzutake]|uniref:uncharacterized protein n=1 Tax=Cantharellus anzutake TaxID=1750568 RepID=UPI001904D838|nr:uncharacterized protein EI90DRAFT_955045 [Cantharellus anzutake]KAF8331641.1 hypothetical protein EI90DRAFT_955045 [Cantharellus anzutake]
MPFSPLVGQIQDWVNEECLNKRYDARRKAFQSFYLLACECEKLGNLASSQAIARALCGGYIRKFNFIRARAEKSAGGSEGLREALQRLSEPLDTVPAIIPPLDYRLRRLLPVFRDIRDNAATINWEACKLFYQNLKLVFQQLVPASPEANVPESYHRFLHDRMYQASLNRSNHQNLSELLFADEARELHQMRAGAGFGF